jgi:RNA polymerase-binding transcription factor DksA
MTARLTVSQHSERPGDPQPAVRDFDAVRAQLLARAEAHASTLARCMAATVATSPESSTDLERAMNALRMYGAREALEEIEGALTRVDAGTYGICLACNQPIPLEYLASIPQGRFCATCPTPAAPAAEGSPEPLLGSGRGEHTGPPAAGVLAATLRSSLASNNGERPWPSISW